MRLKSIVYVVLFSLLASTLSAKNNKHDNEENYEYKKEKKYKKQKHLNKGMQKRLERGKGLPPGWQKKLKKGERLDREVYTQGRVVEPVNIRGEVVIEVDQRLIRLHNATREIIDILK